MKALSAATPRSSSRPGPRHRVVTSADALARVRRRGVDLCAWTRTFSPAFAAWLDALPPGAPAVDEGVTPGRVDATGWLSGLPDSPWRTALADDVAALATLYLKVSGAPGARLQLGWIAGQQCPRFHTDYVGLRLICTYVGPGTEWLEERWLDRELAARCHAQQAPLRPGGAVSRLERFTVGVMKGRAFPGNERHGLVHRSPALEGGPRLVLILNERK